MNKDQIIKAMDEAFSAHVSFLFGVLCSGATNVDSYNTACTRFENGFRIAQQAHDEMLAKLTTA